MASALPAPEQRNFLRPVEPLLVAEALEKFAAPAVGAGKVQILRPPAVSTKNQLSLSLSLPIGPAYLAATLEKAGYEIDLIDAIGEGLQTTQTTDCGRFVRQGLTRDEIIARIDPKTRVLGISLLFSQEWVEQRGLIKAIRRQFPDLVIVAGGEHVSSLPEYVLRDCPEIDYVITNEAEITFLAFVHHILYGRSVEDIPGVCFIGPDDDFVTNGPGNRIKDFANLPSHNYGIDVGFSLPVLATRGCPFQCTFCSSPSMWTTRYLMRDPGEVADEVADLVKTYKVDGIIFTDLTALTRKDWILDFCREIKSRNLFLSWQMPTGTRSEALDEEVLTALYGVGCRLLTYAPESGSPETLEQIKKRITLDKMMESIKLAIALGHQAKVSVILGFPHETRKNIFQSLWFILKLAFIGAHDCYPWIYSPYPGSELYEKLLKQGVVPPPSDAYFDSLHGQTDFANNSDFTKDGVNSSQIPLRELNFYRTMGGGLFYLISYTIRPARLFHLVRNILRPGFSAQNMLEQRLFELFSHRAQ